MTVMLGFARKNDAASSNVKIRWIFIPVHFLYAGLLILGIGNDHMGQCTARVYPKIFSYQYALFFLTYIGFLFLRKNDYFMDWHESIRDMDMSDTQSLQRVVDPEIRKRLNVRILLDVQSKKFMCFFTWLVVLTAIALSFVIWQLKKGDNDAVACTADGNHW